MRNLNETTWAGALVLAVAAVTPANAGPNWVEGLDAGGTPGSAANILGMGPLFTISGNLSQAFGPGVADLEDMFLIRITDALAFSASSQDPTTTFDTQLWLFRFDELDPLMNGLGLLGNNDAMMGNSTSLLGPMSDDGTGIMLTEGLYYLAISGGAGPLTGRVPGAEVPVIGLSEIFDLATPTELSGPDGPGGAFVIDSWIGEGEVGSYVIHLEGVEFVPAPGAAGVLALGLLWFRRRRRGESS